MIYPSADFVQVLSLDHNDQALTAQNGRGQTFSYLYADNESQLTQVLSADVDDIFSYDVYGRLSSVSDAPGVRTFTYDDDDLALSQAVNYNALPANSTFTFDYGYNNDGSRSSLNLTNQTGTYNGSFTYSYDGRGDLTGLVNPSGETYAWTYYANGWLNTQQSGNAATTTYSYNAVGELTNLSNAHGSTSLSSFNMSGAGHYDGAGNLLGLTASLPAAPNSFSGNSLYQYDTHDQLTEEQSSRLTPNTNSYAYDAAGNPTTFRGAPQTFNPDNQNRATAYDNDGNPASWGTNALTFDTASHLTSVGTALTAGYNAEGLRAWKQSSSGSTYFLYDGLTPIAEVNGSTGNVTAVNTWGVAGLASRRSIASNSSTFYTFDVQGNAAQRLDLNGNVLGSYTFDAYGTRYSTDNSTDPYSGFGAQWGYYLDAETGLSLLGHRYYDPGQGRFLNRDPIGYSGGLNLYRYAGNRPFHSSDPTGYQVLELAPNESSVWAPIMNTGGCPFGPGTTPFPRGLQAPPDQTVSLGPSQWLKWVVNAPSLQVGPDVSLPGVSNGPLGLTSIPPFKNVEPLTFEPVEPVAEVAAPTRLEMYEPYESALEAEYGVAAQPVTAQPGTWELNPNGYGRGPGFDEQWVNAGTAEQEFGGAARGGSRGEDLLTPYL